MNTTLKLILCIALALVLILSPLSISAHAEFIYYRGTEYKSVYFETVFRVPDSWDVSEMSVNGCEWVGFSVTQESDRELNVYYKKYDSFDSFFLAEGVILPQTDLSHEKIIYGKRVYFQEANERLPVTGTEYDVNCYIIENQGFIHVFFVEKTISNDTLKQFEMFIGNVEFNDPNADIGKENSAHLIEADIEKTDVISEDNPTDFLSSETFSIAIVLLFAILIIFELFLALYILKRTINKGARNETRKT